MASDMQDPGCGLLLNRGGTGLAAAEQGCFGKSGDGLALFGSTGEG
jgi:hypothetical protein